MIVIKRETAKQITITSDKFDLMKQMLYESETAQRMCCPDPAYGDISRRRFGTSESDLRYGKGIAAKEATSYLVLSIKLWREGCWEINDYCNAYHGTKILKTIVPGTSAETIEENAA
jgi:hypothetical protein